MATLQEYAQLSTRVYPRTDENNVPIPSGWTELLRTGNSSPSGFAAGVYQQGSDIVIAYTGTNEKQAVDFLLANIPAGLSIPSAQVTEAMLLYFQIKQQYPTANISFTGHSLGGGLASLMAVFFDRPATIFDPAPFETTARNMSALGFYQIEMTRRGLSDAAFNAYTQDPTGTLFSQREAKVTGYSLESEVLEDLRAAWPTVEGTHTVIPIGQQTLLQQGLASLPGAKVNLHSMTLLTSMLMSTKFAQMVQSTPDSLKLFFDQSLYATDPQYSSITNFLDRLLIAQMGDATTGAAPAALLDKFADDVLKLKGNAGIAQTQLQKELMIVAMEYYYFKDSSSATSIFSAANGGLHFKYSDIGADSYKSLPRLEKAVEGLLGTSEKPFAHKLLSQNAWHIQQGSEVLNWTADSGDPQNDAAIGGVGVDILDGGAGDDILIGGAGSDVLTGGKGSDTLMGGLAYDTYLFSDGFGGDTIVDADGQGVVKINDQQVTGGKKAAPNYWISDDKKYSFELVANGSNGNDLIITGENNLDTIRIANWQAGQLGINLSEEAIQKPDPTGVTLNGDYKKKNDGKIYTYDGINYASDGSEPDAADMLNGTANNDTINGGGGNDALSGFNGSDELNGGEGDDLLIGGLGRDSLVGGGGNDFIYGSGEGYQILPNMVDFKPIVASGTEWARGFFWTVYGVDSNTYEVEPVYVNTIAGDAGNIIDGGAGNDRIVSGTGNDIAHGGADNDALIGLDGNDALYGDEGDDTLYGDGVVNDGYIETTAAENHGNDVLSGGDGNDILYGNGGNDDLYGGTGNDHLYGDGIGNQTAASLNNTPFAIHGDDYLDGGSGDDTIEGGGGNDELFGGAGNDLLLGDGALDAVPVPYAGDDYLDGEDGDDSIGGGAGNDVIFGGDGNDLMGGDDGDDYLDGEEGNDTIAGGGGNDVLFGDVGNDELQGGDGDDVLAGDAGADKLFGDDGNDDIDSGEGDDTVAGGGGQDVLRGDAGADWLHGEDGDDALYGGADGDHLFGQAGNDYLEGGDGDDELQGGDGVDVLVAGFGNDSVFGQAGNDYLEGGSGDDEMQGGEDDDMLSGGSGSDHLFGQTGNDKLIGDDGDDQLVGDEGNDTLHGGDGNDSLWGGAGNDLLDGDAGVNYLDGGEGDDTYVVRDMTATGIYDIGGKNKIVFDDASSAAAMFMTMNAAGDANVVLDNGGSAYVFGAANGAISDVEFADGSKLSWSHFKGQTWYSTVSINTSVNGAKLDGGAVDDTLTSTGGGGAMYGGHGNDTLTGSGGNNTYFYDLGDGTDTINDTSGTTAAKGNTLVFGAGITGASLKLLVENGKLVVQVGNAITDKIVLAGTNINDPLNTPTISNFKFSDGTSTTFAALVGQGSVINGTAGADTLNGTLMNDFMDGAAGNDSLNGSSGNDTLAGGTGNDSLSGGSGNDTYLFNLGDGIDTIIDADGIETLTFGDGIAPSDVAIQLVAGTNDVRLALKNGTDSVILRNWVTFANSSIVVEKVAFTDGTTWNAAQITAKYSTFIGAAGNDTLIGTSGNDTLDGGAGNDYLQGDAGDDVYLYAAGSGTDLIYDIRGQDTLRFGPGITAADLHFSRIRDPYNSSVDDLLVSDASGNLLVRLSFWFGQSFTSTGVVNGIIERFEFADGNVLFASDINQQYKNQVGTAGNDSLVGTDLYNDTLSGGGGNDSLIGLNGADLLYGGSGDDTIEGYAGNDTLEGGTGNDRLDGGSGSDVYQFARGDGIDRIYCDGDDGAGDVLKFASDILPTDIQIVRNGADLEFGIIGTSDRVVLKAWFDPTRDPIQVAVKFADGTSWTRAVLQTKLSMSYGTSGNDTMTGSDAAADILYGLSGNDSIVGLGGDDVLSGGYGTDTLVGGAGNDTYFYDGQDTIIEAANNGTDTVISETYSCVLPDNVENLVLDKTSSPYGTGNALNNVITGGDAENVIDGGLGADTMVGNGGNDVYYVDNAGDVVTEAAGGGWDKVFSSVTYSLSGTNVEALELTGTAYINGTGSNSDNSLIGNSADNVLTGLGGDDYLNGGDGNDTMSGGAGNDSYEVASTLDVVTENANEGIDTVTLYDFWIGGSAYALPTNVENAILSDYTKPGANTRYVLSPGTRGATITGNAADNKIVGLGINDSFSGGAGNDSLVGNGGNDTLDGGIGADTLNGGYGSDIYYVDDAGDVVVDVDADAASVDKVISTVSYTLGKNIEALYLSGTGAINGTGNAFDNDMVGNSAANVLTGGDGGDTLDGGAGADTLIGGLGNDTYVVDNAGDVITENAGEGVDSVRSSITYTLASGLENLMLMGTTAINGTGNAADNVLTGNSAANVLIGGGGNDSIDGGAGNDTMAGGIGDDVYTVDSSADVVTENANEGIDTVRSTGNYILGANIENLMLIGTVAVNGTGNTLANVLTGNSAANVLDGGTGIDTLVGGLGNDTYVVESAGDVVVENFGEGIDTVQSNVSYVLGADVENLALTSTGAINGTGNGLDNLLTGNAAANVLTGAAGNDTLDGGAGTDTMAGGTGDDVYVVDSSADVITESAAEGLDQVQSSLTYTLANELEVLSLTGSNAINGTGNTANNLIKGNAANNTLDGGAGNDILQGGAGIDTLIDTSGSNLLDAGAGADAITAGAGNDFIVGGAGNDTINTGAGADIIAFNRGDGMDVINASTVKDNTLSLGKGIMYKDLLFNKVNNDLILVTGTSEQITFKDWYTSATNHSIANLQVVIEGTTDYNAASTTKINNKKIELFDFNGLVNAFDQARASKPKLTNWALSSQLLNFYLNSSDTAAIGGDLAYQYARSGNLSNMSMIPTQSIMADSSFGMGMQNLQAATALQDTSPRLM